MRYVGFFFNIIVAVAGIGSFIYTVKTYHEVARKKTPSGTNTQEDKPCSCQNGNDANTDFWSNYFQNLTGNAN